jgi:hypothetical protein
MRRIFAILRRLAITSNWVRKALYCVPIGWALAGAGSVARAQTATACGVDGYRVIGTRWDAVLRMGLEYRQVCAHPEWPAQMVAMGSAASDRMADTAAPRLNGPTIFVAPLMVTAGSPVRLWMQDDVVRIEMNGVVERSARKGERVMVQVTHQSDETGLTVERIAGVVRGPGEVEMER